MPAASHKATVTHRSTLLRARNSRCTCRSAAEHAEHRERDTSDQQREPAEGEQAAIVVRGRLHRRRHLARGRQTVGNAPDGADEEVDALAGSGRDVGWRCAQHEASAARRLQHAPDRPKRQRRPGGQQGRVRGVVARAGNAAPTSARRPPPSRDGRPGNRPATAMTSDDGDDRVAASSLPVKQPSAGERCRAGAPMLTWTTA